MDAVFLKYCKHYVFEEIENAIRQSLQALNIDLGQEITGKKVLLKPNMLAAYLPEKGVTTHPVFVEGIVRVLKDFNCELWLGDSPNGVQKSLEEVWNKTGINDLCDRYEIKKRPFEKSSATLIGDLLISNVVLEADYVINIPKFKTHGLTVLTGAVKNMFGVVPGLKKSAYHREAPSNVEFSRTLVRIAEVRRPDLNIVDGIVAMAGNGPSGGFLIDAGVIAVGKSSHAIDYVLSKLVNVVARSVETLKIAEEMGLINLRDGCKIVGDSYSNFDMAGFKLPVSYTTNLRNFRWFNFLITKYMGGMIVRPRVCKGRCVRCGMCVKICPVSVIKFSGDYPNIDQDKCIGCFCCHETCPEGAIELRESMLLRLIKAISH